MACDGDRLDRQDDWDRDHPDAEDQPVAAKCPCGTEVTVPFNTGDTSPPVGGKFAIWDVECWSCGRRAAAGNAQHGTVSAWSSEGEIDAANAIFNPQWEL